MKKQGTKDFEKQLADHNKVAAEKGRDSFLNKLIPERGEPKQEL